MRDAALSECVGDPLDTFGQGPAELAEDHLALAARAKNHAGTHELERDIDTAGEHSFRACDRGNRVDVVETVLERDHRRVPGHQRRQCLRRRLGVVRLHGEEDEIDRANAGSVGARRDGDRGLAFGGPHREATSLHGLEVRATRDECDVVPGSRQESPVIAADTA